MPNFGAAKRRFPIRQRQGTHYTLLLGTLVAIKLIKSYLGLHPQRGRRASRDKEKETNGQFALGSKNEIFYYSRKEHLKISRIAKFGGESCKIRKIQPCARSLQIFCIFALRAEKVAILSRNCRENGNCFRA